MKKFYEINDDLKNVKDVEELLDRTKLNWTIRQEDVFLENGKKIPNTRANVREDNEVVLGIVTERYMPVSNMEAFDFINELMKNDITIENAGEIDNGKLVYICTNLNDIYVDALKDTIKCKLVFTNAHNGKGSVKVNIVPIINNCPLNIRLHSKRSWNAMHTKSIKAKMEIAKTTLAMSRSYFEELIKETRNLNNIKVSKTQKMAFVEALFPLKNDISDRQYNNVMENRESLMQFIKGDTALSLILGVSGYINNLEPKRKTNTFKSKKFINIVNGYYLLDNAYAIIYKSYIK